MKTAQPLSYGDGMDPPDCPAGPGCACCGPREYSRASTLAREAEASAASARFAARHARYLAAPLDEVCGERRSCNGTPTESCCGTARCADCHREHRADDCAELADDVRHDLFPEGCDHTFNATVCLACAERVDADVRARAERGA